MVGHTGLVPLHIHFTSAVVHNPMANWKVCGRRYRLLRQAQWELVLLHEHCSASVRSTIGDFEASGGRLHRQHVICARGWRVVVAQHLMAEATGKGEEGVWHEGDGEQGAHHCSCVVLVCSSCSRGAGVALGRGSSDEKVRKKARSLDLQESNKELNSSIFGSASARGPPRTPPAFGRRERRRLRPG